MRPAAVPWEMVVRAQRGAVRKGFAEPREQCWAGPTQHTRGLLRVSLHLSTSHVLGQIILYFILRVYLFIFREGEERRKGEKHQCVVASLVPPTGDLACNPGMCPDWELNQ